MKHLPHCPRNGPPVFGEPVQEFSFQRDQRERRERRGRQRERERREDLRNWREPGLFPGAR